MSGDRLAEIAARAEAATLGPWALLHPSWTGDDGVVDATGREVFTLIDHDAGVDARRPDAVFTAHARADVPDLVAAIQRVRTEHWLDIPTGWCGQCVNEHGGEETWPCPTYRATMLPGETA